MYFFGVVFRHIGLSLWENGLSALIYIKTAKKLNHFEKNLIPDKL